MSDLRELYQEVILDHNKKPRNFQRLEDSNYEAQGHNPLCGDNVAVFLLVENGIIKDIGFQGSGCAISKASASLMTTIVKGKSVQEADTIFGKFHDLVTSEISPADIESLGKLAVFSGVREYPARVKCASLAWHTLHAAITSESTSVSTE
jgi:nitrogen fixation protein NifU and related proteins